MKPSTKLTMLAASAPPVEIRKSAVDARSMILTYAIRLTMLRARLATANLIAGFERDGMDLFIGLSSRQVFRG
jgi:hypothetical protein